jgi:TRAP-type C4-dicarboxylate transport system permease small subunit
VKENLERVLLAGLELIMIATAVALPVIISLGVFFRYILKGDLYAIEEIEVFIAMWLYFTGAVYASYQGSQITADIVQVMVKNFKIRRIAALFASFITFAVAAAFFYWGTDMIEYAMLRRPTTAVWKLPLIYEYIPVYASFFFMAIFAFKSFLKALSRKDEIGEESGEAKRVSD